ncbi:MAG: hypothetical protein B6I20_13330 [Bacteroidetes bacterium 4572_117]|nr:MAG: hypothetical protein B6I20_13330 [Bacteroidetes bacterium 4572_117]
MYKIHEIKGHIQSIYIFEYKDKILLADCATKADMLKIEHYIVNKIGRKMGDIKLAMVSHMHPDHAGLASAFQKKYNIPIVSHPNVNDWYRGSFGKLQHFIDVLLAWYVSIKMKNPPKLMWYPSKLKPNYVLEDGAPLPYFNDWQIIYTPGHTSHDISLYHKQSKTIYLGDVILKLKNKYLLPMPITLPGLMKKTLNKLSEIEIENLLLAHGGRVTIEQNKSFFYNLIEQVGEKKKGIFKFINLISLFSPCIRKLENID